MSLNSKKIIALPEQACVYLVGVGGIGMGGLAEVLLARQCHVRGSDLVKNRVVDRLCGLGLSFYLGHDDIDLTGVDVLVSTGAVSMNHPLFQSAKARNIPCMSRAEMLALLVQDKRVIAVSGTHGKTTTTGLISYLLDQAGLEPSYFIGGNVPQLEGLAHEGQGDWAVVEADESDASFLTLSPDVAVITNIDIDHLENFAGGFDAIKQAFVAFINSLKPGGVAILCMDSPGVRAVLPHLKVPYLCYGSSEEAQARLLDCQQQGLLTQLQVSLPNLKGVSKLTLGLAGHHNALNALAALTLTNHLGWLPQVIQALSTFKGVDRRLQVRGTCVIEGKPVLLVEDYGHHPVELFATLQAVKAAWPGRRVAWVFQPHRYTRTQAFLHEFAEVLSQANVIVLMPVYAASESPIAGADSEALAQNIRAQGHANCHVLAREDDLQPTLKSLLQVDDLLLLQGAGDIGANAEALAESCVACYDS